MDTLGGTGTSQALSRVTTGAASARRRGAIDHQYGAASSERLALKYAIPIWERGGIFNGMTGAQLKQLREDLGEAIGRPLTVKDFAKLCGLPPESGGGTILEWEHGYGPIGPVAALLSLLSVASDRYPIDEEIISEHDAAFYRAMMRAGIIRRIG